MVSYFLVRVSDLEILAYDLIPVLLLLKSSRVYQSPF